MKFRTSTLLTLFLAFSLNNNSAFANNPDEPMEELRNSVLKLVQYPDNSLIKYYAEVTEVLFIVNMNREVVVLNIEGASEELESYIKGKLNYKRVNVRDVKKLTPYKIKITFLKR